MRYLEGFIKMFLDKLPAIAGSLVLLIVAIIVAVIVKSLICAVGKKLKLEEKLGKLGVEDKSGNPLVLIANIVALLVFVLFLPSVFGNIGFAQIAEPINQMLNKFFGFVPHLIGAGVLFALGYFIAKLAKQLVAALLRKANIDRYQEKLGIAQGAENTKISSVISSFVFIVIVIPVAIASLQVLNISAISAPAVAMLYNIFNILPNIFVAALLVAVGVFIAKLVVAILTTALESVGADKWPLNFLKEETAAKFSLVKVVAGIVRAVIIILFAVQALEVIRLGFMAKVGTVIVAYLPSILAAVLIALAGFLLASWLQKVVEQASGSKLFGSLLKVFILIFTVFIALNQLGFAMDVINKVFVILIAAFAVAFALAFGLGGKTFASNILDRSEKNLFDKKS